MIPSFQVKEKTELNLSCGLSFTIQVVFSLNLVHYNINWKGREISEFVKFSQNNSDP